MEFIRSQSWIGKRLFGGGGLIPLAPGEPSHVDDHLVRIGNAAGHVFTQHGSGVAPGLRAASLAANAIACAFQMGNTRADGLWAFDHQWWSGPGAVGAEYQPLRYLSSSLTLDELAVMIEAGIITPLSVRRALAQAPMDRDLRVAARVVRHGRKLRALLPRLAATVLLADQLATHARRYPARGPRGGYDGWRDGWHRKLDRARALSCPEGALFAAGLDPRRPDILP
jgi:flavin-dependent dehydrogenase